jgi:PHD/YefM family antitoxin component YafN of YafNO toxin-antitoxin module
VNSITINQFTNHLQNLIKQVINQHLTNQDGADFIVISAEDWDNKKP